ncbi:hypothetical protein AB205_0216400, partial [Aquarana catesbeiana]
MASAVSQVELITAVQAHPELWDVAHPLHGDHIRKVKAWEDISAAITPGWEDLRHGERKEISKILQRRWKSLRDRVRRDLMDEDKAARSGAPAPAKRPYVYHTNLLFLRQNMMNTRPALESVSTASQQGGEQRGRGGVRGRGRQTRGGFNMEADDRVLALLQEVRQERRSMDAFLDTSNPRACFCRNLYHILEDIGGDQEKHCMDRIYGIAMQYRQAKLSGGPPPCDPYNASHDPPMAPGTSAVLAPPLNISPFLNANHHLSRPRPHSTPRTPM